VAEWIGIGIGHWPSVWLWLWAVGGAFSIFEAARAV